MVCYEQQSQSIEYVFKKYKIPFHLELTLAEEEKLLRYTGICPDSLSSELTNELNKIIDTRRKELYVTSLAIEATLSDYLSNYVKELEAKQVKTKTKKLIEEYESIIDPNVNFNKNLLFMIVIAAGVAVAGLFANNASLVIGAMLISPLLGPISAFSFNTAVGKTDKMVKSLVSGLILLVAVIATGALLTAIALQFADLPMTDEILSTNRDFSCLFGSGNCLGACRRNRNVHKHSWNSGWSGNSCSLGTSWHGCRYRYCIMEL